MSEKKLFALRGATQCLNEGQDIARQVALLYDEILEKNRLAEDDIVSLVFSVTGDLTAANPATALRSTGRAGNLALFAVQEAFVLGSLERVLRVLIHCYLPNGSTPCHVYRNGTETLRGKHGNPIPLNK